MVHPGQLFPDAAAIAAARRVMAQSDRVGDGFGSAEIFPREAYVGEDFWRFERWAIFEKEWLCIGHVSQIPNPGDHFTIVVIDEPLIVTRDDAGEVHVLSAICQHRGHPLLDGLAAPPSPALRQNARLLVCPYHAWSYRLDGTLHAAPGMSKTASAEDLRRRVRLPSLRHEIFHGLIFINFDPEANALAPKLAKMEAMIEGYGLETLHATPLNPAGRIHSNWKIYQENSLEPYHTDVVHRNSHNPAPANLSAFYQYTPGDGAIMTTTDFAEASELFAAEGATQLPMIAGLSDVQQGRILFIAVLPTLFLLFEPGSVLVTLALPDGPEAMTLLTFSLFPADAMAAPGFADIVEVQSQALQTIVQEDIVTQEALQRGHRSRFTPRGVLSWLEATIPQMNSWLHERYGVALASSPAQRHSPSTPRPNENKGAFGGTDLAT